MKPILTLAFILTMLLIGVGATACSNEVSDSVYENDVHGGYPGPGIRTQNRDN